MQIEKEIKKELKEQRLQQLKRRYYDLELDRLTFAALGNEKDATAIAERQEQIAKAYETIEAVQAQ